MDPFANLEPPVTEEKKEPASPTTVAPPAPPPRKKRRLAAPRVERQAPAPEPADGPPLREDPCYRLLCAYGKSDLLAPKLKKAGVPCEPRALRRVARARLPSLLEEAEEALDDCAVEELSNLALKQGLTCLERVVASRTRYQLEGMTEACFANERWLFLLERAKLKAGIGLAKMDPLTELALITAQTAALTHAKNVAPSLNLEAPAPEA